MYAADIYSGSLWGFLSKTAKFPTTTSKPLLRLALQAKIDFRIGKSNFITYCNL